MKIKWLIANAWKALLISEILIGSGVVLSSCEHEDDSLMIYDFTPVTIGIKIVDRDGNDLLVEGQPGSWFGYPMSIQYKGEKYEANWSDPYWSEIKSRFYAPQFRGLYYDNYCNNKPMLVFGEFDGACNQEIDVIFKIEGCETDFHITRIHTIVWKHNEPIVSNEIILNGETVKDSAGVTITMPPADSDSNK